MSESVGEAVAHAVSHIVEIGMTSVDRYFVFYGPGDYSFDVAVAREFFQRIENNGVMGYYQFCTQCLRFVQYLFRDVNAYQCRVGLIVRIADYEARIVVMFLECQRSGILYNCSYILYFHLC